MGLLFTIAILSSFYLTPVAIRLAWQFDAVSRPDGFRKKHARPTPEWGGIAVSTTILLGIGLACLLFPFDAAAVTFAAALAVSVAMLCALGCYDDLCDMRASLKLVGQILAITPLMVVGCWTERLELFGWTVELGWLGIAWTMAWFVLGINALNLIDGMDGLASTISLIAALMIAMIAAATGNLPVLAIALVLAGAMIGFLAYNLPPARIYLGDCGSMVLGLMLAVLAMRAVPSTDGVLPVLLASLLLVPLADTLLAVVRRRLSGQGVMAADRGHVHHRLLDQGFGVWGSLAVLGGISIFSGALACVATLSGNEAWAWGGIALIAVGCVRYGLVGHVEWSLMRGRLAPKSWQSQPKSTEIPSPRMTATTDRTTNSAPTTLSAPVPSRSISAALSKRSDAGSLTSVK